MVARRYDRHPDGDSRTQVKLGSHIPLVRKKKRPTAEARNKFIKEEVTYLLKIDSIREVRYPDWLANVVVVPKKNNKFLMCVD